MVRYVLLRTALDPILAVAGTRGLVRLEFLPEAWEYHTRAHAVARRLLDGAVGQERRMDQAGQTDQGDQIVQQGQMVQAAGGEAEAVASAPAPLEVREDPAFFEPLREQLAQYFVGRREHFNLELDLHGTPFQIAVWRELLNIPYGKLRTYGQVAKALGRPAATRAVGQAAGQNPLPVLVPCHRVIGKGGSLVGFAGGLTTKARLLRLEGHTLGGTERIEEPRLF